MDFGKDELMFCNDLLKYGYSKVNSLLVSSYFSCFSNSEEKIDIGDIDKFFVDAKLSKL